MTTADIDAIFQFDDMFSWVLHFERKNKILETNQKSLMYLCNADVIPKDVLFGNEKSVVVTNQIPDRVTNPNCQIFFLDQQSWYGGYYRPDCKNYKHVPIIKKFNCLMNRLEVHRQSCFYELLANDLLDQGNVSMLSAVRHSPDADRQAAWLDMHRLYNSCFDRYLDWVLPRIPYRNFDDSQNEFQIINSTACTLIMDTAVDRSDSISLTEKTLRALQCPRPFLLMASKGTVNHMRRLGFDVYDQYIDHSYDDIDTDENAMDRLLAIIAQLKDFCNRPVTQSMIDHWNEIQDKNVNLLASMHKNFHKNFAVVDAAFETAMRL